MPDGPEAEHVRLAELLGGLVHASDLASGFPHGKSVRTTVLAVAIARRAGCSQAELHDAFYTTLLRFLGCTGFAHEEGEIYGAGDDVQTRNVMSMADITDPAATVGAIVAGIGHEAPLRARGAAVWRLLSNTASHEQHARAQCDTSMLMAEIVGVSPQVKDALRFLCERWDGRGHPAHVQGEELALAARLHHIADVAEISHHRGGRDTAKRNVRKRAGKQLDPRLCEAFLADADALLERIEGPSAWPAFLAAEAEPVVQVGPERLDDVARALGYFADLKSVYTLGHSQAVATLAEDAAHAQGLPAAEVDALRRAAHLHDLGRVGVPNAIWDHPGKLGPDEWERVRMHAYHTERILWQAPPLRTLATLAAAGHERLDGSGYHRRLLPPMIARPARLLAAADALAAMRATRAYRPALAEDAILRELADDVRAGRLDADAVDAVLGVGRTARGVRPAGLSEREVQVLRWVARGKTNKEIAVLLGISARTVQNHVAHVYEKIGVYSRAGAAMFVMERGLGEPDPA